MKFDIDAFHGESKLKLQSINNSESFESMFLSVLNKHVPLTKKFARRNKAPYMTKHLRKAIMRRSELESKYFKNGAIDIKTWAPASNLKGGGGKKNLKNAGHHSWATKIILAFQML